MAKKTRKTDPIDTEARTDAAAPADTGAGTAGAGPEPEVIPGWLPPVVFGVLTLFLFRDFVFSGRMLYGSDTEAMGYMARHFLAEELARGNFPGWNPLLLGGTPFLASLAGGDSLYPPSLLLLLLMEPYRALGWKLVLHVFLAGVGMYGWTRCLGVSRIGAMVAGTGYLVAPFMVTLVYPGHDGKLFVTALTPILFWAVERWFSGGSGRAWAAVAGTVALVILTTHFQMAYFLFGAVGAYALFRTVQGVRGGQEPGRGRRAWTGFGLFLAASVTGAAVAGVQLYPAVTYITEFSRRTATTTQASPEENRAYGASWSLHPEEAMSLAVPEFVGNNSNGAPWAAGTYWGRNPFKLNHEYVGVAILLLALLSFVGGPRKGVRLFLAGAGGIALLYALGANTPVWGIFFELLPGVSLFRAPSMVIFITGLALCTLAGFGADRVLAWRDPTGAEEEAEAVLGTRVAGGVVGALGLLLLLAGANVLTSLWGSVFGVAPGKEAALAAAEPFITQGAFVSLLIAGGVLAALILGRRRLLPVAGVTALLVLVVAVDGARVDGAFIETRDFDEFYRVGPNIQALLERQATETPFRVLDLSEPAIGQGVRSAMFGLEIASGHHPNDLARYRELSGMVGSGVPENLIRSPNLLSMLNVRYILWPVRRFGEAQGLQPVSATQFSDGQIFEAVYQVPDLPRARLVARAEVVPDSQAVARLMDPSFDMEGTVTVPEALEVELGGGDPAGDVSWISRETDRKELQVSTDQPALLVVADNWYPAWQAEVDGEPVPVLRVNHTLQGIPVPAGSHAVVLRFASGPVRTGLILSVVGLAVMVGAAGSSLLRRPSAPAA
jgi:hypothetical protein